VSIERGMEGADPIRPDPVESVLDQDALRRDARTRPVASGTLACPECDVPVVLPGRAVSPAEPFSCSFCGHDAHVRDFLSLAPPTRPTRVVVRLRRPGAIGAGSTR
jgi:hypothetical protein